MKNSRLLWVKFYRMWGSAPIGGQLINRHKIPSGGLLNYNPSPEWTHVTIDIGVDDLGPMRVKPDIWHWYLPLDTWRTATIKEDII